MLPIRTAHICGRAGGRQCGFTLFELIVVICVVALMAGMLMQRLQGVEEQAEKVAMQQIAVGIKSALQMRIASLMIAGREGEIGRLVAENPVNWLQEKPENYVGEFQSDPNAAVPPGNWYFDTTRRELVYIVKRGDNFKPGPDGKKRVRYRVKIEYDSGGGAAPAGRRALSAATLALVEPFYWL